MLFPTSNSGVIIIANKEYYCMTVLLLKKENVTEQMISNRLINSTILEQIFQYFFNNSF